FKSAALASAADALLFTLDALLHAHRRARIFAQDLAERCAGRFPLAERGQRLAEPEQCVGGLGGGLVFGRDIEERFGGVAIALALKHALAEPVLRVGRQPVARIFAEEGL